MSEYSEYRTKMLGVEGVMFKAPANGGGTTQLFRTARRAAPEYGVQAVMQVVVRFDDQCGNGHDTFSITGDVWSYNGTRDVVACGCLHDDIREVFPELAGLIKWHLCSTDGPMHYEANAVYLAGDRDYNGKRAGEALRWSRVMMFDDVPVMHAVDDRLGEWLEERLASGDIISLQRINHPREPEEPETFGAHYAPVGYECQWSQAPWRSAGEARRFCKALNKCEVVFTKVVTQRSEGKERQLDAARDAAVWPGASDAQLSVGPEALRAALRERLPALLEEMRRDLEGAGLAWRA